MFNAGMLNLMSLVLGLAAWAMPTVGIVARARIGREWGLVLSVASMSACAASVCLQPFYTRYLVQKEDWSALMDTASAVANVCAVLVAVAILLNLISIYIHLKRKGA